MNGRLPAIIIGAAIIMLVVILGGVRQSAIPRLPEDPAPSSSAPSIPPVASSTRDGYLSENVRSVSLAPGAEVASPLRVTGEARRYFFEASFPVEVYAGEARIGGGLAHPAPGYDWMTADFVPFVAEATFTAPSVPMGTLVLRKDNPSGLPEHDEEVRIPVRFAAAGAGACRKTGCSGQICAERDMVSTCEFRAEYACYREATCARGTDGVCGWVQTLDLALCLKNPPPLE